MHAKTMEGLIGTRTNIELLNTPLRVYKEARLKGDTDKMEQAMGYMKDFEAGFCPDCPWVSSSSVFRGACLSVHGRFLAGDSGAGLGLQLVPAGGGADGAVRAVLFDEDGLGRRAAVHDPDAFPLSDHTDERVHRTDDCRVRGQPGERGAVGFSSGGILSLVSGLFPGDWAFP